MSNGSFLKRALAESARYGDDPWVFIRELGQNSRDAGAGHIEIRTFVQDGRATLVFLDDGVGMTLEHAKAYLFRLYASSKEGDALAAGRYGVGFWSVLRYRPERIEVHSRCRGGSFGVVLTGSLDSWRMAECRTKQRGTAIVLSRPIRAQDEPQFRKELSAAVERYLAHLRCAGRRAAVLQVLLDGQRMDRPLALSGPGVLVFREGPVEGVVGFGPRPAYLLYARGLPVTQGAFLDELEGQNRRQAPPALREGVAPVFLLNGNNLDVVLSRQTVIKNRALDKLLKVARRRFDELVSRAVDSAVVRSPLRRALLAIWGFFRRAAPPWVRTVAWTVLLLLLGGAGGLLISKWIGPAIENQDIPVPLSKAATTPHPVPALQSADPGRTMAAVPPEFGRSLRTGTVVPGSAEPGWAMRYEPPAPLMLRLLVLGSFDPARGWRPDPAEDQTADPEQTSGEARVRITLEHGREGGRLLVPVPSEQWPVAGSGRLGDLRIELRVSPGGQVEVELPPGKPEPLIYQTALLSQVPTRLVEAMSAAPAVKFPPAVERRLRELANRDRGRRIQGAVVLAASLVKYDLSPATVEAYRQLERNTDRDWLDSVLRIGAGDCDIINGVLVALLRRLSVPARLVVGIVGRDGEGLPGLHAWAEVIDGGGLVVVDATAAALAGPPVPGPVAASPAPPVPAPLEPAPGTTAARPLVRPEPAKLAVTTAPLEEPAAGLDLCWLVFSLAGGIGLLLLLLALRPWLGRTSRMRMTQDSREKRQLLAGMVADALRNPSAWRHAEAIWYRPVLPCLGGRFLSLMQVIRRAQSDSLFVGSAGSELASEALQSRVIVLDSGDPDFGRLFQRLEGLRNLDELSRLKPVEANGEAQPLLDAINRLLLRARTGVVCRAAQLPDARLCAEVDLNPIRPGRRSGWPARFLAVNLDDQRWIDLQELFAGDPGLAVAVAVDRLTAVSRLLSARAATLRRRAARWALERAS